MNYNKSNYQDVLKTLAIFAMILDHIGLYMVPDVEAFRIIGRFAMPVFCFFAGYNFKGRPRLNVLIYGTILYLMSTFFVFGKFTGTNILISIFLGQVYIKIFEHKLKEFWFGFSNVIILGCLWVFTFEIIDYGTLAISVMIIGYLVRFNPEMKLPLTISAATISYIHTFFCFVQFSNFNLTMALIVQVLFVILLNIKDFQTKINLNLQAITRYSLEIYCFHFIAIQLIWRYYLIG